MTIELDYTYDTNDFSAAGGGIGFFASNPVAKASLEAAAFDLGNSITSSLAGINVAAGQSFSATSGGVTTSIDPNWVFTNPTTKGSVSLDGLTLASSTFRIYVGSQLLNTTTLGVGGNSVLGQGGHGSVSYETGYSAVANAAHTTNINTATAAVNAVTGRGPAVGIGSHASAVSYTAGDTTYTGTNPIAWGPTLGNLWFDADTDNNNSLDTLTQLNSAWHFDHTTTVVAGKNDFYSVALHEMMHSLGYGSSDAWDNKVVDAGTGNDNWSGAAVIALKGTGAGLIDAENAHVAGGITGTRITTISTALASAGTQEAVMGPSITTGSRKIMTDLDQAFLQDIGYTTTTAIPEPSAYGLLGAGALAGVALVRRRQARRGVTASAA